MLNPCQFRNVTESGQLVCARIAGTDREVTNEICQACPVGAIGCAHLRVTLEKSGGGSIIVRYGNGRSEVWSGEPSGVRLRRAACAALCAPVTGPQTCVTCNLHRPAIASQPLPHRAPAPLSAVAGS